MSLRRVRQLAVERAAETGARAALQQIAGETAPSQPTPALSVSLEMVSVPPEGAGAAVVRAVGTRRLQGALGNEATAAATRASAMRETLADIEVTILPLPGGVNALEGYDPIAEAAALLGEEAPPRPETSPPSASSDALPPPSDAVAETAPGVEAAAGEAAAETAEAVEELAADVEAAGEGVAEGEAAAGEAAAGEAEAEGAPAEGEGEAPAEGEAAAGGGEAGAEVPILMPEPPSELSPDAQGRVEAVQGAARGAARRQADMPPAGEHVSAAQGAVTPPQEEMAGRAQASVVELLGEQPGPSPEIEALCTRIKEVIRSKRPPDEDSLVDANPRAMASDAGTQMNQNVQGDANRVAGSYNSLEETPPGEAPPPGQAPEPIPGASSGEFDAQTAAPDPVPTENVSLEADVAANQQRMEEAGMNSPAAQEVQTGPIAEAREAQGELQATAERDPAEVLAEQEEALGTARGDMAALQEQALAALEQSRTTTTGGVEGQRGEMVGTESEMRAEAGRRAQAIFTTAQTQVTNLLNPLPRDAMNLWERGVAAESERFEQSLAEVKRWIDERHEGVGGAIVGVWDAVTGLPDWVTEAYDRAERLFGDGICALIREISTSVNTVIASCQALIAQADRDIAAVYDSLPAELQGWAAGERERFQGQLSSLSQRATETRDNFNRDLVQRASQAVQDVRTRIHELREAAKGLIGRIADAIAAFIDDPARAIINGLLSLLGIAPSAFWALVARIEQVIDDIADDPMGFANNLVEALKQGFQQFFDNFGRHFLNGLLEWLFSGLGSVGVQVPSDFSLRSVITFFLQIMGLTWPNIRKILVKYVGEENVALVERAWEFISTLIEMGPEGIFELIKEQLNPQNLLDTVLQMAVDFVIQTLIEQVAVRVLGLLNPAGAIVQAIELIYKVGKWVFENAARIFTLIETVVNGIADVLAGNIGGMANAVERALAGLMVPVIDFLASLLSLGDLPNKVAEMIGGFQERVLGFVDRAIGWVVQKVKALLAKLGLKEEEEPEADGVATIHEPVEIGTEDHTIDSKSGSYALVLHSPSPGHSLSNHPNDTNGDVKKAYQDYLDAIDKATSPTGKKEAANSKLPAIVAAVKKIAPPGAPGASAPGIGEIAPYSAQQKRLKNEGIPVWVMWAEHVIPRAFVDAAFSAQAQAGVPAGRRDYGRMHTILIYKGAQENKDSGPFGDQAKIREFESTISQIVEQVLATKRSQRTMAIQYAVGPINSLLSAFAVDAEQRTNAAIQAENATNAVARGPAGSPEPITPDSGKVHEAANKQKDDIREQLLDRLSTI